MPKDIKNNRFFLPMCTRSRPAATRGDFEAVEPASLVTLIGARETHPAPSPLAFTAIKSEVSSELLPYPLSLSLVVWLVLSCCK